jgi:hypothetical protein
VCGCGLFLPYFAFGVFYVHYGRVGLNMDRITANHTRRGITYGRQKHIYDPSARVSGSTTNQLAAIQVGPLRVTRVGCLCDEYDALLSCSRSHHKKDEVMNMNMINTYRVRPRLAATINTPTSSLFPPSPWPRYEVVSSAPFSSSPRQPSSPRLTVSLQTAIPPARPSPEHGAGRRPRTGPVSMSP